MCVQKFSVFTHLSHTKHVNKTIRTPQVNKNFKFNKDKNFFFGYFFLDILTRGCIILTKCTSTGYTSACIVLGLFVGIF